MVGVTSNMSEGVKLMDTNLWLEVWRDEDDSGNRSVIGRIYRWCVSKKHRGQH